MNQRFSRVMITGATGYVGQRLARRFLAQGAELYLPIRARDAEEFGRKKEKLLGSLNATAQQARVIACDLTSESDLHDLPRDSELIIHSAADTRFNISAETANAVNRDASLALFNFARTNPQLKSLAYISTAYAAGEQDGVIPENLLLEPRPFVNHYERSKWETEVALAKDFTDLPWQIHRVATVIADNDSGDFTQLNAVHNTLKLLYYGLVSLVPGLAHVPIYLVCGDFVEQGIMSLIDRGALHEVFHICHSREESLTLEQFVDAGFQAFLLEDGFRKRGLQKPLLVDEESFRILADGLSGFGSPFLNEAMGSMIPFARQLYISKDFENNKVRAALPDYQVPDAGKVIRNLVLQLVHKKWKV